MDEVSILINCQEDDARELQRQLEQLAVERPLASQQKKVGGDVAAWVLIFSAVVQTVPAVLQLLATRLGPGRVTRIKIGDIEFENPSPEDLERLRALIEARAKAPPEDSES